MYIIKHRKLSVGAVVCNVECTVCNIAPGGRQIWVGAQIKIYYTAVGSRAKGRGPAGMVREPAAW